MLRILKYLIPAVIISIIILHGPFETDEPAASPEDHAKEDLSRVVYPSTRSIRWKPLFIRPQDTLENLYGKDWEHVARFNRIDRRHVYPGMTIKSPLNIDQIKDYTPMPREYEPARRYSRYILVNMEEQWLGAYENGILKFSFPAATGRNGYETPTGIFRVDARHKNHTSSLYKTEDETTQYPMDYAIRFYIGADNVAYWIHARDLPGRPASHGCVGLYDEAMQKRIFTVPEKPVLQDSKRLYDWAVGENRYGPDSGNIELLENGPIVEIIGKNPEYLAKPPRHAEIPPS
ncbi:MAG: L,D-transpeptidase [Geobacteraceae bacterium]|nr:L,D-transpeptidase [Geobacteraceae bacterium]